MNEPPRRIGVLGGTFDPIHYGHLLMADRALRHLELETVMFVPTGRPSHRDPDVVSCALDRCAMTRLALDGKPNYRVSMVDVLRPKPTYTIDTIQDLRAQLGFASEFYLIIGADNLASLLQWAEADQLAQLVHFVACSRSGYSLKDPGLPRGRLIKLRIPHHEISSSRIRQLVRSGCPISQLTTPSVISYIQEKGLYSEDFTDAKTRRGLLRTDRILSASSNNPDAANN